MREIFVISAIGSALLIICTDAYARRDPAVKYFFMAAAVVGAPLVYAALRMGP